MHYDQGLKTTPHELVTTHAQLVTTHYEMDTTHARLVFPDFAIVLLSCPPSSPLSSLFLLIFLIFFVLFIFFILLLFFFFYFLLPYAPFLYTSSFLTVPSQKIPSQQGPNPHPWLIPSHLGLFCRTPPCLSKCLEGFLHCLYCFC
jgi:hypothetical protein